MNSLTTTLTNIRRSPYQSLAAILLLSLTFFVWYALSFFILGSEQVLRYFETRPQVIAFFELNTQADTINQLAQTLRTQTYVTNVTLITQEEALKNYQSANRDDPLLLELVTAQILPASLEVSGQTIEDLQKIKDFLQNQTGVEEVVLQQDVIDTLSTWTTNVRWVGLVSTAILALSSLLTMIMIISMKVVVKRPAINIMRIIGATRWFIKSPFVFEGIIYGLVSSAIGWSVAAAGLLYLTPWLINFLGDVKILPIPPGLYATQLSAGSLMGMFLGAVAGSVAVGRIMRK